MFLMVMGVCLVVVAWRIALTANACNARLIVVGGLLLGFGYAVLLPLHETGLIVALAPLLNSRAAVAETFGWHMVILVVMNCGWLLFGTGLALHARVLRGPLPQANPQPIPAHDPLV